MSLGSVHFALSKALSLWRTNYPLYNVTAFVVILCLLCWNWSLTVQVFLLSLIFSVKWFCQSFFEFIYVGAFFKFISVGSITFSETLLVYYFFLFLSCVILIAGYFTSPHFVVQPRSYFRGPNGIAERIFAG